MAEASNQQTISCRVKWFNPNKGFGFLVDDTDGPDILLHANVLRDAGRSTIADGVQVDAVVAEVNGKRQAISVTAIYADPEHMRTKLAQFADTDPMVLQSLPFQPARVKWFDQAKGIGFANVFGIAADVFIHLEVLKASGLASLESGEAIALRVLQGDRGLLAAEITDWNMVQD